MLGLRRRAGRHAPGHFFKDCRVHLRHGCKLPGSVGRAPQLDQRFGNRLLVYSSHAADPVRVQCVEKAPRQIRRLGLVGCLWKEEVTAASMQAKPTLETPPPGSVFEVSTKAQAATPVPRWQSR